MLGPVRYVTIAHGSAPHVLCTACSNPPDSPYQPTTAACGRPGSSPKATRVCCSRKKSIPSKPAPPYYSQRPRVARPRPQQPQPPDCRTPRLASSIHSRQPQQNVILRLRLRYSHISPSVQVFMQHRYAAAAQTWGRSHGTRESRPWASERPRALALWERRGATRTACQCRRSRCHGGARRLTSRGVRAPHQGSGHGGGSACRSARWQAGQLVRGGPTSRP